MKRAIALPVLLVALLGSGVPAARADAPPAVGDFHLRSASGRFVAEISSESEPARADAALLRRMRIRVFESASGRELWQSALHHPENSGGLLSDDGQFFATVDFWYRHDTAVVEIYRHGRYCFFTGRQLGIDPATLRKTVSHQLWLAAQGARLIEAAGQPPLLVIQTVQGERRIGLAPVITWRGQACQEFPG